MGYSSAIEDLAVLSPVITPEAIAIAEKHLIEAGILKESADDPDQEVLNRNLVFSYIKALDHGIKNDPCRDKRYSFIMSIEFIEGDALLRSTTNCTTKELVAALRLVIRSYEETETVEP